MHSKGYNSVHSCSSSVSFSLSVMSDSLQPHGLWPTRLLWPWDSPGKNTGVDCIPFSTTAACTHNNPMLQVRKHGEEKGQVTYPHHTAREWPSPMSNCLFPAIVLSCSLPKHKLLGVGTVAYSSYCSNSQPGLLTEQRVERTPKES